MGAVNARESAKAQAAEVSAEFEGLEDVAPDSGGEEFGDDGGSDGGQRRWAAHQLELKLARGGDPLIAVEACEFGQAVLGEFAAEGGFEEGGRVGVGSDGPGEDDVGPVPLENRIQLVIGKCSVPQAACVYSLIRPLRMGFRRI